MAKFALINEKEQIVHKFAAEDIAAARVVAAQWVQQNVTKVYLVGLVRVLTPRRPLAAVEVDDLPA